MARIHSSANAAAQTMTSTGSLKPSPKLPMRTATVKLLMGPGLLLSMGYRSRQSQRWAPVVIGRMGEGRRQFSMGGNAFSPPGKQAVRGTLALMKIRLRNISHLGGTLGFPMRELNDTTPMPEEIAKTIVEVCDRNRDALLSILQLVTANRAEPVPVNHDAAEISDSITRIKAKAFISASEAALLFGCSAQHLRNLVQRAIESKATEPIPFCDLDGVVVFPVPELMEWCRKPKAKPKRVSTKNKTPLKVVAS